jgi:hypothetical protein
LHDDGTSLGDDNLVNLIDQRLEPSRRTPLMVNNDILNRSLSAVDGRALSTTPGDPNQGHPTAKKTVKGSGSSLQMIFGIDDHQEWIDFRVRSSFNCADVKKGVSNATWIHKVNYGRPYSEQYEAVLGNVVKQVSQT